MPGKECKSIKSMYRRKGVRPPKGKGVHTRKFHQMASSIMQSGSLGRNAAYATAMKKLGRNKAVKKSHWRGKK